MPIPEPIPAHFYPPSSAFPQTQFRSVEDVNNVVQLLLWKISRENRYTGAGCVQEELLRNYPTAFEFLRSIRMNPDAIPRLTEHKRMIQRVNTQLWAYATTRNVLTIADMEQLVQMEDPTNYRLLGPVTLLPAVLEIFQISYFHPRIHTCYSSGHEADTLRMTTEQVLEELTNCVCSNRYRLPSTTARSSLSSWWESMFTHHMLLKLGNTSVPSTVSRNDIDSFRLDQLCPYGIRIKGFAKLVESVTSMLRPESLSRASQCAQSALDSDIHQIYQGFASKFLSPANLETLRKKKPIKVLKHLANCASELHETLQNWAQERDLVWPAGHLDSLLVFGQFMERIATTGPFRTLVHLLILIANTDKLNLDELIARISSGAVGQKGHASVIDLTDSPRSMSPAEEPVEECQTTSTTVDDVEPLKEDLLASYMNKLNSLIIQHMESSSSSSDSSESSSNLWISLASLEKELFADQSFKGSASYRRTLLDLVAEAIQKGLPDMPDLSFAKLVQKSSRTVDMDDDHDDDGNNSKIDLSNEASSHLRDLPTFDPSLVCQFVRKLTCLTERSQEEVCDLVCSYLKIDRTSQLEQLISSFLVEHQGGSNVEPLIYHKELNPKEPNSTNQNFDWSLTTSSLITNKDNVLDFLSACPSLVDLECWSQWYMTGLLPDRWGPLDEFLSSCGAQKVCEQFNLIAIRLLPHGPLLRLTANFTNHDLEQSLKNWLMEQTPRATFRLADMLIGLSLGLSSSCTLTEACQILQSQLIQSWDRTIWINLVYDLLMHLPYATLGLVFSKVIVPVLHDSSLRSSSSWASDLPNVPLPSDSTSTSGLLPILKDLDSDPDHVELLTALGCLGFQLRWPALMTLFDQRRINGSKRVELSLKDQGLVDQTSVCLIPNPASQPGDLCQIEPITLDSDTDSIDESDSLEITKVSLPITTSAKTLSTTSDSNRYHFIEELRRREFGFGADLSQEAADLVQRVEGKLSRSLVQLSENLYGMPGHFLYELIQNADDNSYASTNDGLLPTLEFRLVRRNITDNKNNTKGLISGSALLVMNNESIGFTEADIAALCDVGLSTKTTQREMKIGRKGIGFKSVFVVTNVPEVHSNGFHVRFKRPESNQSNPDSHSLILIPEWCGSPDADPTKPLGLANSEWPITDELTSRYKTLFILPLSNQTHLAGSAMTTALDQQPHLKVLQLTQTTLHPSVMLFLRRLKCIRFHNEQPSVSFELQRFCQSLATFSSKDGSLYTLELITVKEIDQNQAENHRIVWHQWFVFRESVRVDVQNQNQAVPKQTDISIAISLTDAEPCPTYPVFAYLPVRSAGFNFYINADFDLTSSREDVDGSSSWNQWLIGKLPSVCAHLVECTLKLPASIFTQESVTDTTNPEQSAANWTGLTLSRPSLLGRLVGCLPYNKSHLINPTDHHHHPSRQDRMSCNSNLFLGLADQLRTRLNQIAWLPALIRPFGNESQLDRPMDDPIYVKPEHLLLLPGVSDNTNSSVALVNQTLENLLITCLHMYEPHPELICNQSTSWEPNNTDESTPVTKDDLSSDSRWQQNALVKRSRLEALHWLGAQTISIDSLIQLVSNLKPDVLIRPGLLAHLISSFETCLSNPSAYHVSRQPQPPQPVLRRRLLTTLNHLCIFPLMNEQLIRLANRQDLSEWAVKFNLPILLPPSPSQQLMLVGSNYDDYISLISKLGPLLQPRCIYDLNNPSCSLSPLLTSPNPNGLGLSVATPETVLSEWILPCLKQIAADLLNQEQLNWCIIVGQFFASCDLPMMNVPTSVPIVVTNRQGEERLLPPLSDQLGSQQRQEHIYLPPASFTIGTDPNQVLMEEQEMKLFQFVLDNLPDDECLFLVSPSYFKGFKTHLNQGYRWFEFFSNAGVCTLLSVHKRKYYTSNTELFELPHHKSPIICENTTMLPSNHRLHNLIKQALTNEGLTKESQSMQSNTGWLVEDYVSPGLDLILSCLKRQHNKESAIDIAYMLAAILHDNWSSFDRLQGAFFSQLSPLTETDVAETKTTNPKPVLTTSPNNPPITDNHPHCLGLADWLFKLRTTKWLPIEKEPIDLACTTDLHGIYSPAAFVQLQAQHSTVTDLLKQACQIWAPGPYILHSPPNSNFAKALGLLLKPDCSTFEALMHHLATTIARDNLPTRVITPSLMLLIYRSAVTHFSQTFDNSNTSDYDQALTQWLRSVFVNPNKPSLLVLCSNSLPSSVSCIKRRSTKVGEKPTPSNLFISDQCPLCCDSQGDRQLQLVDNASRKRSHSQSTDLEQPEHESRRYHLVQSNQVCWEAPVIGNWYCSLSEGSGSVSKDQEDEVEGEVEPLDEGPDDQCFNFPWSTRVKQETEFLEAKLKAKTLIPARNFLLSQCYGSECRQFFVDKLGIAATSSIGQILALRPRVPTRQNGQFISPQEMHSLGKQLGQWYALIDYCLSVECTVDPSSGCCKANPIIECVRQFPLLLDSAGQWHKPCEVSSSIKSEHLADKSGQDGKVTNKLCLFAWSKPVHARFMHLICNQQSTTTTKGCQLLAHSLNLLDGHYHLHGGQSSDSGSDFLSNSNWLRQEFIQPKVVAHEGTAHGLLLDVLGLPVLDRVSSLNFKPQHSSTTIPCRSLDQFLKAFMTLANAWARTHHGSRIETEKIQAILDSSHVLSYLVDHLEITLSLDAHASLLFHPNQPLTQRTLAFLLDYQLFLDSTLGAELFARLSMINADLSQPIVYLLAGLWQDAELSGLNSASMENSLLFNLLDYLFPCGGPNRRDFSHFMQGFINMLISLEPHLTESLNKTNPLSPATLHQLETYLTSHGLNHSKAKQLLRLLCPELVRTTTDSSSHVQSQVQPVSSTNPTESTTIPGSSLGQTEQRIANVQSHLQGSTRFDTVLGSLLPAQSFSQPLSKETNPSQTMSQAFWSNTNAELPSYLVDRLQHMLSDSGPTSTTSTTVGRMGELFVYHTLTSLIKRSKEQSHHHFDQPTSLDFPTGHPLLGMGRLVRCNWCNSDNESLKPYDFEVEVQVESDASKWPKFLQSLSTEFSKNLIRIVQHPNDSHSKPGLLNVGPIFLEVKSTNDPAGHSAPESTKTDLFEISMPELTCATEQGWRYHLVRVVWSNWTNIKEAPKVIHVPNLLNELKHNSAFLKLCLAMLRTG